MLLKHATFVFITKFSNYINIKYALRHGINKKYAFKTKKIIKYVI